MQPLKLSIEGAFYDSHLYKNKLYLFGLDGVVRTYDWERLLRGLRLPPDLELAMEAAFLRSDLLYGQREQRILFDREMRSVLLAKFERLSSEDFVVTQIPLRKAMLDEQQSPFPFPHSAFDIYYSVAYAASSSGLFRALTTSTKKKVLSRKARKLWDAPISAVSASYHTLVMSCGYEGLWEYPVASAKPAEASRLSAQHSNANEWSYHSLFAESNISGGYMVSYTKDGNGFGVNIDQEESLRKFDRVIDVEEMFNSREQYAWACRDKVCAYKEGVLRVARYDPFSNDELLFKSLGQFKLSPSLGDVVSASVSVFGVVMEFDRGMVIVESTNQTFELNTEPVNWKIFPRANFYANQLHVMGPDRLEIFSFNHDFLVNQNEKIFGYRKLS